MDTMKYKECEDCIKKDDNVLKLDCGRCSNGSLCITYEDFNADMDFWCGGEPPKPEEDKLKYFLIRWLIRLIIKIESKYCWIWFNGIESQPKGRKQEIDGDYPILLKILSPFVYVWQYRDGGYTGDDFAGNLYFRLFPFVWLSFGYEC